MIGGVRSILCFSVVEGLLIVNMIDGSKNAIVKLAFQLQSSRVIEKQSKANTCCILTHRCAAHPYHVYASNPIAKFKHKKATQVDKSLHEIIISLGSHRLLPIQNNLNKRIKNRINYR